MKKCDATKKRLLAEAHNMAQSLRKVDIIDIPTMKKFDALCLTEIQELSATKIKKIRRKIGVSQAVLAKIINVSVAAIKQWERGERRPSGAALKLLNLVDAKGLDAVL